MDGCPVAVTRDNGGTSFHDYIFDKGFFIRINYSTEHALVGAVVYLY